MSTTPPQPPQFKTPGQYLQYLLEQRGWTQSVLSIVIGVDRAIISKIVADSRQISAEMALALGEVFQVPAERFLDLQCEWDLAQARLKSIPDPARAYRARLFGELPVSEIIKRGWISVSDAKNVPEVERALAKFFGVTSAEEIEIMPHAAKKTEVAGDVTPTQLAWLYRVKQIAADMLVPKYSRQRAEAAIEKLKGLLQSADEIRRVPRILEEAGIRFVIVETLPAAKIDGVCFWLDDESPVIGMSCRYDRIDNFWFVLRHELEHVLREHGKDAIPLDVELEGDRAGTGEDLSEEERVANEAAAEFCVPKKSLQAFVDRKAPFFAERDLLGFARSLQIHPGLVAGQLQRRLKRYDRFRNHLVKVRSAVAPGATVDGWGDIYPLEY